MPLRSERVLRHQLPGLTGALNDPYDWNGSKEPIVMACEADSDGALTMQILKLISGYPSVLLDIRSYDARNEIYVCCNCGALPSWS